MKYEKKGNRDAHYIHNVCSKDKLFRAHLDFYTACLMALIYHSYTMCSVSLQHNEVLLGQCVRK